MFSYWRKRPRSVTFISRQRATIAKLYWTVCQLNAVIKIYPDIKQQEYANHMDSVQRQCQHDILLSTAGTKIVDVYGA